MQKIPKKIHYIWLSNEKLPKLPELCIESWKRHCYEYEMVLWDMDKCKNIIDSVSYVKEAVQMKKWAFASDYIRLFAVYAEGGIYLDSDIYLYSSFDRFLEHEYFTNVEFSENNFKKYGTAKIINSDGSKKDKNIIATPGIALQAAIFAGRQGHPFLKSCMEYYESKHFILPDGNLDMTLSPHIYAHIAQDYGFLYKDVLQKLRNDMAIYPSEVFFGSPYIESAFKPPYTGLAFKPVAIHLVTGTWRQPKSIFERLLRKIRDNNFIRKIFLKKSKPSLEILLKEYEAKKDILEKYQDLS